VPRGPGDVGADRIGHGTWPSIPRELHWTLGPSVRLSTALMDSLSDAFSLNLIPANSKHDLATFHSTVHSQVCHIIRAKGNYIHDITSRYFKGVHRWLPIVSKKWFNIRLTNFKDRPPADFSILLLTMRLITQYPSKDSEKEQEREVLYLATKTLFAQVQTLVPSSLYIIQAGIILATYEHGHGMIEAAYVTIGTTARIAFAEGIHNKQCSGEPIGTDDWLQQEEALSTWWGLVICDR
jgi:hypothetical protein